MPESDLSQSIICPACHGVNPPDAVFCGNPGCGKALGEFDYVLEEVGACSSTIERLADKVNRFTGHPHFVTVHVAWFGAWVLLNSGVITFLGVFDAYPYSLLGIVLGVEAILITGFLLISQNRQNLHAEKRAELDYEVSVRSYRKLNELQTALDALLQRVGALEARFEDSRGSDPAGR